MSWAGWFPKWCQSFGKLGLGRCRAPALEVTVQVRLQQPEVSSHLSSVTPGLTSSAGQEEQEQRWKGIMHEEKGKEHNVSLDKQ